MGRKKKYDNDYERLKAYRAKNAKQKSSSEKKSVRNRSRQIALRFESDDDATNDGNLSIGWRLGATRIDIKSDGRR